LPKEPIRLDLGLLVGVAIALCAVVIGIMSTGVGVRYFLHPTGAVIVLGGTLGVVLVTTPFRDLVHSGRRVAELLSPASIDREALIEEIVQCARFTRRDGLLAVEALAPKSSNSYLRNALLLVPDVKDRAELQGALELDLRLRERQGESDAKTLEVAGGFAPTLGILGTVVGLIEVMRQFSNIQAVGYGIGTAFVSTIYGLALANLILLPIAHRIRARVAETFEAQELMMEGVLYLVDDVHPSLIRLKLGSFLRTSDREHRTQAARALPLTSGANS
jgi:chemotaxis protein MotA